MRRCRPNTHLPTLTHTYISKSWDAPGVHPVLAKRSLSLDLNSSIGPSAFLNSPIIPIPTIDPASSASTPIHHVGHYSEDESEEEKGYGGSDEAVVEVGLFCEDHGVRDSWVRGIDAVE